MAKKKKPTKKAKISKTEKRLRDDVRNARRKLKPIRDQLHKIQKADGRKLISFEGKKRKKKTIINLLLNKASKVNNTIDEKITKLEDRFKYKRKAFPTKAKNPEENDVFELSRVFEQKKAEEFIYKYPYLETINGISIKQDSEKIQDLLNKYFMNMTSKHIFSVEVDGKGNGRLFLMNLEDTEEFDGEF